jgi:hypothetical protein
MKAESLKCTKCGRFLGRDGYPRSVYDDWNGGIEVDPLCGPCGRKIGYADLRLVKKHGDEMGGQP